MDERTEEQRARLATLEEARDEQAAAELARIEKRAEDHERVDAQRQQDEEERQLAEERPRPGYKIVRIAFPSRAQRMCENAFHLLLQRRKEQEQGTADS